MSAPARARFEPWAYLAFALAGATAALFLFLGSRPGGELAARAFRWGPLVLGCASAVGMLAALAWCLRRRPILQRGRAWPLLALGTSLWFCSLPIAYPSSYEGRFSTTRFRLPFEGPARVTAGGEDANPLLFDPARRFGTVFRSSGDEQTLLPIVAPAAGAVVGRTSTRSGEALVLATAPGEFCVLEGLEPGSCTLEAGASVAAGERIGTASGRLSMHLQDAPAPGRGEGIPMRYWGYRLHGRPAESGVPIPPQEVEHDPAGTVAPSGR
jgi:hypothetical protein